MQKKSCYLSAPYGAHTVVLHSLLQSFGLKVWDGRSIAPAAPLHQAISEAIATADYFIAVLPPAQSSNAYFELGLAVGLGKPVALIAKRSSELPSDLAGLLYSRADLTDRQALHEFLRVFLERTPAAKGPRLRSSALPTHRLPAEVLTRLMSNATSATTASRFEEVIRSFFNGAGYIVSPPFSPESRAADFAVWIDELESAFGNPILVEVKWHLQSGAQIAQAEEQLRAALRERDSRLALLVYHGVARTIEHAAKPVWPLVIPISLDRLAAALRRGTLERDLLAARNRLVHSSSEA